MHGFLRNAFFKKFIFLALIVLIGTSACKKPRHNSGTDSIVDAQNNRTMALLPIKNYPEAQLSADLGNPGVQYANDLINMPFFGLVECKGGASINAEKIMKSVELQAALGNLLIDANRTLWLRATDSGKQAIPCQVFGNYLVTVPAIDHALDDAFDAGENITKETYYLAQSVFLALRGPFEEGKEKAGSPLLATFLETKRAHYGLGSSNLQNILGALLAMDAEFNPCLNAMPQKLSQKVNVWKRDNYTCQPVFDDPSKKQYHPGKGNDYQKVRNSLAIGLAKIHEAIYLSDVYNGQETPNERLLGTLATTMVWSSIPDTDSRKGLALFLAGITNTFDFAGFFRSDKYGDGNEANAAASGFNLTTKASAPVTVNPAYPPRPINPRPTQPYYPPYQQQQYNPYQQQQQQYNPYQQQQRQQQPRQQQPRQTSQNRSRNPQQPNKTTGGPSKLFQGDEAYKTPVTTQDKQNALNELQTRQKALQEQLAALPPNPDGNRTVERDMIISEQERLQKVQDALNNKNSDLQVVGKNKETGTIEMRSKSDGGGTTMFAGKQGDVQEWARTGNSKKGEEEYIYKNASNSNDPSSKDFYGVTEKVSGNGKNISITADFYGDNNKEKDTHFTFEAKRDPKTGEVYIPCDGANKGKLEEFDKYYAALPKDARDDKIYQTIKSAVRCNATQQAPKKDAKLTEFKLSDDDDSGEVEGDCPELEETPAADTTATPTPTNPEQKAENPTDPTAATVTPQQQEGQGNEGENPPQQTTVPPTEETEEEETE